MKGSKKLDILVYLLFFGILAMFAGLIFSFFKTGHFELVEERKDLAAGVQKITIASDISQVEIRQGEGDAPYIVYDRQVAKDARENAAARPSLPGAVPGGLRRRGTQRRCPGRCGGGYCVHRRDLGGDHGGAPLTARPCLPALFRV